MTFLLCLACLAAGLLVYVYLGRDTALEGRLPLPRAWQTVSPAHGELLRYGQAMDRFSTEVRDRLLLPGNASPAAAQELLDRLEAMQATWTALTKLVSRRESAALFAWDLARRLFEELLLSAHASGHPEAQLWEAAQSQVELGSRLAQGKGVSDYVSPETEALRGRHPIEIERLLDQVRAAAKRMRLGTGE